MTKAYDIDGTWTLAPDLYRQEWDRRIACGWTCIIVTGREQPKDKLERLRIPSDAVIIVSGPDTKEFAALKAGYRVDVWEDDMPGMIQNTRILGGEL